MTLALPAFEGYPFPTENAAQKAAPLPVPTADLRLWLDASRGVTLDGATARVASWTSRVGSLSAAQATTAAMPVFATGTINGRDAILYDGADDVLWVNALAADLSGFAVPFTWFTVERAARLDGYRVTLSMVDEPAYVHAYNGGSDAFLARENDAEETQRVGATGAATTNATVASYVYDGSGLFAWRDGALVASGAPGGGALTALAFAVGAAANGSAFYAGAIGEALVYARALSSAERAGVEAYLKGKWGTP